MNNNIQFHQILQNRRITSAHCNGEQKYHYTYFTSKINTKKKNLLLPSIFNIIFSHTFNPQQISTEAIQACTHIKKQLQNYKETFQKLTSAFIKTFFFLYFQHNAFFANKIRNTFLNSVKGFKFVSRLDEDD